MRRTLNQLNTRLLALAAAMVLMLLSAPAALAAESGGCGSNLTWTLSDGRLTITGSGDMTDYDEWTPPPWYENREEIRRLTLPEGLTHVGNMAFYGCTDLAAVTLPSTVKTVGELAFCRNSSLAVLSLNSGLTSIGRSAFEQCVSLTDLRLPNTVTYLGTNAFSRCTGLRYASVPASVSEMENGVFAYCENLVQVDVQASLSALPGWTFYGCEDLNVVSLPATVKSVEENAFTRCDNLSAVDYGGSGSGGESVKNAIVQEVPSFQKFGTVNTSGVPSSNIASDAKQQADGSVVLSTITVNSTENATVSTSTNSTYTAELKGTAANVEITANVVTPQGWDEVVQQVKLAEAELAVKKADGLETGKVQVTAYLSGDEQKLPQTVLAELAGSQSTVTVQTSSGSRFAVDCAEMEEHPKTETVDFTYEVAAAEEKTTQKLEAPEGYQLRFAADAEINAEVMVKISPRHARKTAALYQQVNGELQFLQSTVIDHNGYAHFYLGCVDGDTQYIIGINVPGTEAGNPIIPAELRAEFGITDTLESVEYVLTGRKSSWGMSISQVTWIMVGAMTILVVMVGVTMYLLNKRKLRMGYVPVLDEEDE